MSLLRVTFADLLKITLPNKRMIKTRNEHTIRNEIMILDVYVNKQNSFEKMQ